MKISNETKVGILATFAIVMLILGYNYLKGVKLFSKSITLYSEYESAAGLTNSDDVIYRGLSIGKVSKVSIKEGDINTIVVAFSLKHSLDIPLNSEARIVNADLLGEKALEIRIGDSTVYAIDGDYLNGTIERNLSQQIEDELIPVKEKIEVLLSNLDSVITRVNGFFDVDFRGKVDENLQNIAAAISNIRNITQNVDFILEREVERLDTIMNNVGALAEAISKSKDNIVNTFDNLSDISDSLAQINLVQTFEQVDRVTKQLAEITEKVNNGEGTLGLLLNDEELYKNLEKASSNLNAVLEDIRKNPGRYIPSLIRLGN